MKVNLATPTPTILNMTPSRGDHTAVETYQPSYGPGLDLDLQNHLTTIAEEYVNTYTGMNPEDPKIDLVISQIMDIGNSIMSTTVAHTNLLQATDAKDANAEAISSIVSYADTISELDNVYRQIDIRGKWWARFLSEKTVINKILNRHRTRQAQITSISSRLEKMLGQINATNLMLHESRATTWELFGALNNEIYKLGRVREYIEQKVGPQGELRKSNPGLADVYYNKIHPALARKEADLEVHYQVLVASHLASEEEHRANEYRRLDGASLLTTNRLALEVSAALKSARQNGEVYDKAAGAAKETATKLMKEMAVDGRASAVRAAEQLRETAVDAQKLLEYIDMMRKTAEETQQKAAESAAVLRDTSRQLKEVRGWHWSQHLT